MTQSRSALNSSQSVFRLNTREWWQSWRRKRKKLSVGYAAPVLWIDDVTPEIRDMPVWQKYARQLTPEEIQWSPSKYFLPLFGVPKGRAAGFTSCVWCCRKTARKMFERFCHQCLCVLEPLACRFDLLQRRREIICYKYHRWSSLRTKYLIGWCFFYEHIFYSISYSIFEFFLFFFI